MSSPIQYRLIVRRGPQINQVFELTKPVITLGRDIINDITISDAEMSRQHCQLVLGADGYTLIDNDSTNGTFVNGQRIDSSVLLKNGDTVGFGEIVQVSYAATQTLSGNVLDKTAPINTIQRQQVESAPKSKSNLLRQRTAPKLEPEHTPIIDELIQQGLEDTSTIEVPSPPAPEAYIYTPPVEAEAEPEARRILFLGCMIVIILCMMTSVMSAILIDVSNAWGNVPIVGSLFGGAPVKMTKIETKNFDLEVPRDWEIGISDFDDSSLVATSPDAVTSDIVVQGLSIIENRGLVAIALNEEVESIDVLLAQAYQLVAIPESAVKKESSISVDDKQGRMSNVQLDDSRAFKIAVFQLDKQTIVLIGITHGDDQKKDFEIFDYIVNSLKFEK